MIGDLGLQHAHDAELVRAELDGLAHRIAAVGRAVDVIADDADLLVVCDVHILDVPALGEGVALRLDVVLIHAVHRTVTVLRRAYLGGVVAEIQLRRDGGKQFGVLFDDVVQIIHRRGAGTIAPYLDGEGVGSHCGKAVPHASGHAVAQTDDDDDCHDADDAQHGQEGAQLIAPDVLQCLAESL